MVPETGELDWNDLDRCLTDHRTRLLAIGAASNALGTINDVARAVAMAREAEALSFVDAVHFAPHQLIDVQEWGCDFLACSAYKFHGPHVGVLYGRREQLEALDVPKLQPAPETVPGTAGDRDAEPRGDRRRGGRGGLSGLARTRRRTAPASADSRRARLRAVFETLHERGAGSSKQLWDGLSEVEGVRLFGPPPARLGRRRSPSRVKGQPAEEVSRRLADRGIFASHGDFYAMTVARAARRGRSGFGPARLCLLHDRRRGCSGHRWRAGDRSAVTKYELVLAAVVAAVLLRKLGMRVRRVEMVVPDRVVKAVERNRSRLRVAIDVAGDSLRPKPEPAGIFAVGEVV